MIKTLIRQAVIGLLIAAVLAAPSLYGRLTASTRITPALSKRLNEAGNLDGVWVRFAFVPEHFHIRKLQDMGVVAGVEGTSIRVLNVSKSRVGDIAGFTWVKEVDVLD